MANSLTGIKIEDFFIESLDGSKKFDLANGTLSVDYYEDILEPCVSMKVSAMFSFNIVSELPIRGGEKVELDFTLPSGNFKMDREKTMYVYKVGELKSDKQSVSFNLYLSSKEHFINEISRCPRKFENIPISTHVETILKEDLFTEKECDIEETRGEYSFYGNTRKPFYLLQWLAPKAVPVVSNKSGTSGEDGTKDGESNGTSGYFFYENQDGFNFRSVEKLVSNAQVDSDKKKAKFRYISKGFGGVDSNSEESNFQIIEYFLDKNIDVRRSLRIGMYSNQSIFYNTQTHLVSYYKYDLQKQVKGTLGGDGMDTPAELFAGAPSRQLFRTSDHGATSLLDPSSRDEGDMARSFSRYNLLFTQSLNILVPCNIKLMVGDVIFCELPSLEAGKGTEIDTKRSGNYLIKELCHHFSLNQNTTSLKLIRDSYGVYGTNAS